MPWIVLIVLLFLIFKLPDLIADYRYNKSDNNPSIGKILEDKYKNNLSDAQIKNNIASGKYDKR